MLQAITHLEFSIHSIRPEHRRTGGASWVGGGRRDCRFRGRNGRQALAAVHTKGLAEETPQASVERPRRCWAL
jgi:hypothetical protein